MGDDIGTAEAALVERLTQLTDGIPDDEIALAKVVIFFYALRRTIQTEHWRRTENKAPLHERRESLVQWMKRPRAAEAEKMLSVALELYRDLAGLGLHRVVDGFLKQQSNDPYSMQSVLPGSLFIGPVDVVAGPNTDQMEKNGIEYVVSIVDKIDDKIRNIRDNFATVSVTKIVDMLDYPGANLNQHFSEVVATIDDGLQNDHVVLVHCNAGMSRSAAFVIAYLMWRFRLSFKAGMNMLSNVRTHVQPNRGFVKQLRALEETLSQSEQAQ